MTAISKPHLRVTKVGDRNKIKLHTPEKTLPHVKNKASLMSTLDRYANPFIKNVLPDTTQARRRYVEITRPALRWFCKQYGVDVPSWLVGNAHYDEMEPEQFESYFGPGKLKVREFEEVPQNKDA